MAMSISCWRRRLDSISPTMPMKVWAKGPSSAARAAMPRSMVELKSSRWSSRAAMEKKARGRLASMSRRPSSARMARAALGDSARASSMAWPSTRSSRAGPRATRVALRGSRAKTATSPMSSPAATQAARTGPKPMSTMTSSSPSSTMNMQSPGSPWRTRTWPSSSPTGAAVASSPAAASPNRLATPGGSVAETSWGGVSTGSVLALRFG